MPTIHNTLLDPLGAPIEDATVEINLLVDTTVPTAGGYVNASEATISWTARATTNASGYWSASVPTGNDDISPAGSVYQVVELRPGAPVVIHYVDVPVAAGTYWIGDYAASPPDGSSETAHALGTLTNVDTSAVADNYVLTYDSVSGTWVAEAAQGGGGGGAPAIGFYVVNTTGQYLPEYPADPAPVVFTAETQDDADFFTIGTSTSEFSVATTGWYSLVLEYEYVGLTLPENIEDTLLFLQVDSGAGFTDVRFYRNWAGVANDWALLGQFPAVVHMEAGDSFRWQCQQADTPGAAQYEWRASGVYMGGASAAAHTVASHSDTSATGTQLNTLVGGGDVGALHTHAAAYDVLGAAAAAEAASDPVGSASTAQSAAEATAAAALSAHAIAADPHTGYVLESNIGTTVQAYDAALDAVSGTNTGDEVSATLTTEGIVELATQGETNTGTDAARVVTPSTLSNWTGLPGSATAGAEGLVELATQAEVDAEADASRVVTPATLGAWAGNGSPADASTTVKGIIELATQAEVDAETDTVRAVTPATLGAWTGGGGGGAASVVSLLDSTKTADTPDDEFNDGTNMSGPVNGLDSQWTVAAGSSGTATLIQPTTAVSLYDTSVDGLLRMQVGPNATDDVILRQAYTLADGESFVVAAEYSMWSGLATPPSQDQARFQLSVGSSTTSPRTGEFLEMGWEADAAEVVLQSYDGTSSVEWTEGTKYAHNVVYLRILRSTLDYRAFISGGPGKAWTGLGKMTATSALPYIYLTMVGSASPAAGQCAVVHWARLGGSSPDPW